MEGSAFEELKERQSCRVAGGKGSPDTDSVLGTVLGGLDAMPQSRYHFTGEENKD